jgi:Cu(I)/Ag(I) efflux system membrane fusion protein
MKLKILTAVLLILFIGGAAVVISGCSRSGNAGKATQEKAVYYCPMHPTYTSDRPGDCPICNMKLVKKEARESSAPLEKTMKEVCIEHNCTMEHCDMKVIADLKPGERISCPICGELISTESGKIVEMKKEQKPTVTISPEKQQLIGIKTEPVMKMALSKVISASGRIAYDPDLVITQEEYIQALNNKDELKDAQFPDVVERVDSLISASRNKLKLLGMSEDEIIDLEKTRKAQTNLYLPSPGENVWAYISIYEYEIGVIKSGYPVEIEAVAYPGETFEGKVISINPVLDAGTRTNQVRVEVLNPEDKLKPEMFVNARISINLGEKLAVPESAILDTGMRKLVYISRQGDLLEAREVKVGQKARGYYEVLEGLDEGDVVVTSGNFFIDSESKLKSALEGTGHQHGQ